MADWSTPSLSTLYTTLLTALKDRDINAATLFSDGLTAATNIPTGAIRFNRASKLFEEWSGAAWVTKQIDAAGLVGLGSMASQNANNVAITGGYIQGITADIKFSADINANLGEYAKRVKNVYIGSGLIIPVGTDKWVTS